MRIQYEDCKPFIPPTEEDDRQLAKELGWTLEEFYDTMGKGFISLADRDKYIKEQRKKREQST